VACEMNGISTRAKALVLTRPHCGFAKQETMPTDSCLSFYECTSYTALMRRKPGDCCVCVYTYGKIACPPISGR